MSTPIRHLVRKTLSPRIIKSPNTLSPTLRSPSTLKPQVSNQFPNKNISKCLNYKIEEYTTKKLKDKTDAIIQKNYELEKQLLSVPEDKIIPSINTPERKQFLNSDLSKLNLKVFGKGSFGTVVQASYKDKPVAIKIIPAKSSVKQEHNALKLNHPNILPVLLVFDNLTTVNNVIVMGCCAPLNLQNVINNTAAEFPLSVCAKWIHDVCLALEYCHHNFVLHLDIKPKNVLLKDRKCLLCDFGSSLDLKNEQQTERFLQKIYHDISGGTIAYTAPELLHKKSPMLPTFGADIYSLGVTMWQIHTRNIPFQHLDNAHTIIYQVVKNKLRPKLPQIKSENGAKYCNLYVNCWQESPELRPTIDNILKSLEDLIG